VPPRETFLSHTRDREFKARCTREAPQLIGQSRVKGGRGRETARERERERALIVWTCNQIIKRAERALYFPYSVPVTPFEINRRENRGRDVY